MRCLVTLALALAVLPGCGLAGSGRSRVQAPALELRTAHRLGGPLSALAPAGGGSVPLAVTIEGFAVQRLPDDLGEPVVSRAALITGPRNEPLAATASAAELLRSLPSDDGLPPDEPAEPLGEVVPVEAEVVLVPTGCTVGIELAPAGDPDGAVLLEFIIAAAGTSHADQTGLPQLLLRARPDEADRHAPADGPAEMQTLVIPWPLPEATGRFALALPALPRIGIAWPTVWRFTVEAIPGDSDAAAESAALAASLGTASADAAPDSSHAALAAELRGTTEPARLRSTIAFAALEAGADVCGEAAVLLADASLPLLAQAMAETLETARIDPAIARVGWDLDRAAMLAMAPLQAGGKLGPAAGSMLSARFGEVGRDPTGLAALAKQSASADDFRNRLTAEHLLLLDDVSPATRVRAFDWLSAAGSAPPGYDPLDPVRQRREAVERFLQTSTTQP